MTSIISGVFFRLNASATLSASAAGGDVLIEQLLASAGNRVRFQSEEVGQESISATAKFDGFQTRIETPLLLVEQTIEEQNGGLEFIG